MESGTRKKRINYTVMIVSDSPDGGIQPFCLEKKLITAIISVVAILLVLAIGTAAYHGIALREVSAREEQLSSQLEQVTQEKEKLTTENTELADKVAILSEKVAKNEQSKLEEEKVEEAKKIPNGFPLAGPAVILESSETASDEAETEETEKEPIVVFSAEAGIKVIATASGSVKAVEEDAEYGYKIVMDHGNGYESIYRVASEPVVDEGDEVVVGAALYEIQGANEKIGYQLSQDGTLMDPLDLLEVYG